MAKKKAGSLEISDIRVKYDKNDGSLRITSKDPDLRGKPFSLTITGDSPSAQTMFQVMRENGLAVSDAIPTKLTVESKAELESFYDPKKPLQFTLGKTYDSASVTMDLASSPHVLLGGGTGSGRSILLRSLLAQIGLRDNFKLTVFDPTTVEIKSEELRLQDKVINTPEALALELADLDDEIQYRYSRMEAEGVNHFTELSTKLPYRILMLDSASKFLTGEGVNQHNAVAVARHELAKQLLFSMPRLSRAAGIHIIISDFSLDPKTIPGETLANIGTRIMMGSSNYLEAVSLLGDKPAYGQGVLHNRGRGVVSIYREQTPFQSYYIPSDLLPNGGLQHQ